MAKRKPKAERAVRAEVSGTAEGSGVRERTVARAGAAGVLGWVRRDDDAVRVHAEGDAEAVEALLDSLRETGDATVDVAEVKPEGHEQFAIRGASAGIFVVQEHVNERGTHFDFRLEVDGVLRSWAVPKGPSMDPAVKRMAIGVPDHDLTHADFEGELDGGGSVRIWDRGTYEQGGRVPWPEAIERGHAVFVLHGELLRGGFALQRTRGGDKPQWLLIKRRDEEARPGSDVVAEADYAARARASHPD